MKTINLKEQLKDIKGNPIGTISKVIIETSEGKYKQSEDGSLLIAIVQDPKQVITVGQIISEALVLDSPGEKTEMLDKAKRFSLSMKIIESDDIELSDEQITLISKQVNLLCEVMPQGIQIAGRIYDILNK